MKHLIISILSLAVITSCNSQSEKQNTEQSYKKSSVDTIIPRSTLELYIGKEKHDELLLQQIDQRKDTLSLLFSDSLYQYKLIILAGENFITSSLSKGDSIIAKLRNPAYNLISQSIELSPRVTSPHSRLKGQVDLKFIGASESKGVPNDTIAIRGNLLILLD